MTRLKNLLINIWLDFRFTSKPSRPKRDLSAFRTDLFSEADAAVHKRLEAADDKSKKLNLIRHKVLIGERLNEEEKKLLKL